MRYSRNWIISAYLTRSISAHAQLQAFYTRIEALFNYAKVISEILELFIYELS